MNKKPNLIFIAGSVLVFPNFFLLADIANQVGIVSSACDIPREHAKRFQAYDEFIALNRQIPSLQYFSGRLGRAA